MEVTKAEEADHKNDASHLEIKKEGIYSVMWKFPNLADFHFPIPSCPSPLLTRAAKRKCFVCVCILHRSGGRGDWEQTTEWRKLELRVENSVGRRPIRQLPPLLAFLPRRRSHF